MTLVVIRHLAPAAAHLVLVMWSKEVRLVDGKDTDQLRNVLNNKLAFRLWPGRSIFRVGTREIANKFNVPHDMAPDNRKDFFLGSVNFHWSIDQGKTKVDLIHCLRYPIFIELTSRFLGFPGRPVQSQSRCQRHKPRLCRQYYRLRVLRGSFGSLDW